MRHTGGTQPRVDGPFGNFDYGCAGIWVVDVYPVGNERGYTLGARGSGS
jgi:hypothetical protein